MHLRQEGFARPAGGDWGLGRQRRGDATDSPLLAGISQAGRCRTPGLTVSSPPRRGKAGCSACMHAPSSLNRACPFGPGAGWPAGWSQASEYTTHKWTVYMRGANNEDLTHLIQKVRSMPATGRQAGERGQAGGEAGLYRSWGRGVGRPLPSLHSWPCMQPWSQAAGAVRRCWACSAVCTALPALQGPCLP